MTDKISETNKKLGRRDLVYNYSNKNFKLDLTRFN